MARPSTPSMAGARIWRRSPRAPERVSRSSGTTCCCRSRARSARRTRGLRRVCTPISCGRSSPRCPTRSSMALLPLQRRNGIGRRMRHTLSAVWPDRGHGSTKPRRPAMPEREGAGGSERAPFAYATVRVVPRVEREEFVNVGVVLYSRPRAFLGVQARLNRDRLCAFWPELDLDAVERQLDVIRLVVAGDPAGGAIALLPAAERFGWLSAPASTILQPGPVHAGLADDPEAALHDLFVDLVSLASSD